MSAPDLLKALELARQCGAVVLMSESEVVFTHTQLAEFYEVALTYSSVDAVPVAWLWTLESTVGGGIKVTQADMRGPQFFKDRLGSDFSPFGRRGHDIAKDETQVKITAASLYAHPVPAKSEGGVA